MSSPLGTVGVPPPLGVQSIGGQQFGGSPGLHVCAPPNSEPGRQFGIGAQGGTGVVPCAPANPGADTTIAANTSSGTTWMSFLISPLPTQSRGVAGESLDPAPRLNGSDDTSLLMLRQAIKLASQ